MLFRSISSSWLMLLSTASIAWAEADLPRPPRDGPHRSLSVLEPSIDPGVTPDRALAGEEIHSYSLKVSEGRWWIEVYQAGIDCELELAELQGPSGSSNPSLPTAGGGDRRDFTLVSSPFDSYGPEMLAFEARPSAEYRLTVRAAYATAAPGHYRLSLHRAEATASASASTHELDEMLWQARQETTQGAMANAHAKGSQRLQKLREARRHYAAAAEIWERSGRTDEHMAAVHCVGILQLKLDQYADAEASLAKAVDGWRRLGRPHLQAEAINYRGLIHQDSGDLGRADELFNAALELYRRLDDPYGRAIAENNLCLSLHRRGNLEAARGCYPDVLAALQAGGNPGPIAGVLNSLGGVYYQLGEPTQARRFYAEALDIYRSAELLEGEAGVLNNRAALSRYLGDWQEALDDYDRALEIQRSIGDQGGEARALNNIGYAYLSLGDPERAMEKLSSALEIRRRLEDSQGQAVTLTNLGTVYESLGNPSKALIFRQRALDIRRRIGRSAAVARTLTHIAGDLRALGRTEESLESLEEGLKLSSESGDRRFEALALAERGRTLMEMGRWTEAEGDLTRALSLQLELSDRQSEVSTRVSLASLALRGNRLDAAQEQTQATLDVLEKLRVGVDSPELRAAFLAAARRAFELDIEVQMAKHRLEPRAGHDARALTTSERARARTLLDLLVASRIEPIAGSTDEDPPSQERQGERLRFLASKRNQAVDRAFGPERLAEIDAAIADVPKNRESPEKRLGTRSAEEIVQLLDDNTILVEISLGQRVGYLWWVDTHGVQSHELPAASELEATALQAYKELSTVELGAVEPAAAGFDTSALERLSRWLLGPIDRKLQSVKPETRLMVVADGALHYIPFAALTMPGSQQPLIQRFEVVQLPSASTLGWLRSRAASNAVPSKTDTRPVRGDRATVMVFADPTFGPDLAPLPATRAEALAIADLLPENRVRIALGAEARKSSVLGLSTPGATDSSRRLHMMHFATHGVFDAEHPGRSGLMLAQRDAEGRPIDGFLTLADIYGLELSATLVVLSGCRTALGRRVHGEGLIGLSRGFLQAGAQNVIAGLWRVEDAATSRLMIHFYRALLHDGLSPATALRRAQLDLLNQGRLSDPYYWAAFVLLGEGQ